MFQESAQSFEEANKELHQKFDKLLKEPIRIKNNKRDREEKENSK